MCTILKKVLNLISHEKNYKDLCGMYFMCKETKVSKTTHENL